MASERFGRRTTVLEKDEVVKESGYWGSRGRKIVWVGLRS